MSNEGKHVSVHYVGTLDDGTKFDSSRDRGMPLEFICMAGQMIPGFDAAVREMEVGQIVNVHLEPSEAYGERREDMVVTVPIANMPGAEHAQVGMGVLLGGPMGQQMPAVIVGKDATTITFDLNHEMAGKALNFEIELLSVAEPEDHHCCHGQGHGNGECCHGEGKGHHHEDGECCHGEGECCEGDGEGCCCE